MKFPILGLYAGGIRPMPGDGRPTAIFKLPIEEAVEIGAEGLAGDTQADRRFHGGPDKAVHHFPRENLRRLAAWFPEAGAALVPGSFGENVSTDGIDEDGACIGDVFALGTARVQLCQPRTPCWKIDARFAIDGVTRAVDQAGIAGWYYRVLAPGRARVGDDFELIERASDAIPLREFWNIVHAHRPAPGELERLLSALGLAENWLRKLRQRRDWLARAV